MSELGDDIILLAARLGKILAGGGMSLTTVESCTGGGIAYAVTAVPGSSGWFRQGLVTYSNEIKHSLAGVDTEILERFGAVSRETVRQMAAGGLASAGADVAVAVSGIAGPDGGTAEKPVGTVWIACAARGELSSEKCFHFTGDRAAVREATIRQALIMAADMAEMLNNSN